MYIAICTKCKPPQILALSPSEPRHPNDKRKILLPSHTAEDGKRHEAKWKNVGDQVQKPGEKPQEFLERVVRGK